MEESTTFLEVDEDEAEEVEEDWRECSRRLGGGGGGTGNGSSSPGLHCWVRGGLRPKLVVLVEPADEEKPEEDWREWCDLPSGEEAEAEEEGGLGRGGRTAEDDVEDGSRQRGERRTSRGSVDGVVVAIIAIRLAPLADDAP